MIIWGVGGGADCMLHVAVSMCMQQQPGDTEVPLLLLHSNLTHIFFPDTSSKPSLLSTVSDMLSHTHTHVQWCLLTGLATQEAKCCFSLCTCLVSLQVSVWNESTSAQSHAVPRELYQPLLVLLQIMTCRERGSGHIWSDTQQHAGWICGLNVKRWW